MDHPTPPELQEKQLRRLVKIGLIRELFQRSQITRSQFESLMKLHRT